MPIYNMHTHIFPQKIAEKATDSIGQFYDIPMEMIGTSEALLDGGREIGVEKYLVCSVATKAAQVESIYSFVADECRKHPEFIGYGSLHPDCENIEKEVDNLVKLGLKGIKLHPDFQLFNIDDEKAMPIYEQASERGLPILCHMGDNRYTYSHPSRLMKVMKRFPKLIVIAAHLGGYQAWDDAEKCELDGRPYFGNENMFIDTSSSLPFVDPVRAVKIIRRHGVERTFFGTDSPMWNEKKELERFMALPLTDDEKEKILGINAKRFLAETAT
ncbi:MAG: amidohydrolase family protein [Clostridia bacterium]|nr:amidohydrolase family protein [Clostridia bacterium]